MLFDPRLFNAIWVDIACTAVMVGLATMASPAVSMLMAIQVLRGKAEHKPLIVETYLRRRTSSQEEENTRTLPNMAWPS